MRGSSRAQEAKVVWYTSLALTSSEKVAKLFETALPGREGRGAAHRLAADPAADDAGAPGQHQKRGRGPHSDAGHYVLLKEKQLLMRYTPAGVDRFAPGFKDKDGFSLRPARHRQTSSPTTPEGQRRGGSRTWKDLLDPKWRGSSSPAHPVTAG